MAQHIFNFFLAHYVANFSGFDNAIELNRFFLMPLDHIGIKLYSAASSGIDATYHTIKTSANR